MKNHVVLIIVLFLLVLVTANCTSSNNSELLYIDEKGIIHIEIEKILERYKYKTIIRFTCRKDKEKYLMKLSSILIPV